MSSIRLASFGIAIAFAIGCGSSNKSTVDASGGPDASTDAGLTAAQACADIVHAVCEKRDACTNSTGNDKTYGSESLCESRTLTPCETDLMATGTAATPATREACAQDYTMADSTCVNYYDDDPTTACTPPAGSLSQGTACGVPAQCESTYCAIAANYVCGTCQPLPAVGDTCAVDTDCGRDLACAGGKCAAYVALSGACLTGTSPCQGGLSCVGDDVAMKTTGTCQAAVSTVGGACDSSRKTMPACEAELGLVCIPTTGTVGTCQTISLVGATQTCGPIGTPITGFADCSDGGLCVKASSTAKTGTCVAPAADGAACDSVAGPPCLDPAKCVPTSTASTAGTCTIPNATTCH